MHALLHSVPPALQQATTDLNLCQRLLDILGQVWVSLLWGTGAHKFLFLPSKSFFPVLYKFWWLSDGVNGNLLQEGLCLTQACYTQIPCPCGSPLLTRRVSVVSLGLGARKVCLSSLSVSGRHGI